MRFFAVHAPGGLALEFVFTRREIILFIYYQTNSWQASCHSSFCMGYNQGMSICSLHWKYNYNQLSDWMNWTDGYLLPRVETNLKTGGCWWCGMAGERGQHRTADRQTDRQTVQDAMQEEHQQQQKKRDPLKACEALEEDEEDQRFEIVMGRVPKAAAQKRPHILLHCSSPPPPLRTYVHVYSGDGIHSTARHQWLAEQPTDSSKWCLNRKVLIILHNGGWCVHRFINFYYRYVGVEEEEPSNG